MRSLRALAYAVALSFFVAYPLFASSTERLSVDSDGNQGTGDSEEASVTPDGRYVVFGSSSSDLVAGDTNDSADAFVHDRETGLTERVSVSSDGTQGDSKSYGRSISADGRYVLFGSYASNLVAGDTKGSVGIFVHDREMGLTARVSVASDGTPGDMDSGWSSMSADGRYVVFGSYASNLVTEDTNGYVDVFLHDRETGLTELVSAADDGTQGDGDSYAPSVSADGRYVAFESGASNLVAGDADGYHDIFLHDREMRLTELVSVASDGTQGNSHSYRPCVSANGRYVVFRSEAATLVTGDTNGWSDIFLRDREEGITVRMSVGSDGTQGDDDSYGPSVSADGRYVVFHSDASNLVAGDTNGSRDVFVRDRQTFADVPVGLWAFYATEACVNAGIAGGYPDDLYHPERQVTRGQMAVFVSRGLAGGDENVPEPTVDPGFTDVDDTHWAYKYICYVVDQNIASGYPEGDYKPDQPVTRDQMSVYIARAMVAPDTSVLDTYDPSDPRNFPDVPSDYWAYPYVEYCVEHDIVGGYLDGTYRPTVVVTRDQMAIYIARAFELL